GWNCSQQKRHRLQCAVAEHGITLVEAGADGGPNGVDDLAQRPENQTVSLSICRWLGGEMRGHNVAADLATAAEALRESGDFVAHDVAVDRTVADDVRAGDLQPVTTQRRDRDQMDGLPDHHRDLSTDRRTARAWRDAVRQQDHPRSRPVAEREL